MDHNKKPISSKARKPNFDIKKKLELLRKKIRQEEKIKRKIEQDPTYRAKKLKFRYSMIKQ